MSTRIVLWELDKPVRLRILNSHAFQKPLVFAKDARFLCPKKSATCGIPDQGTPMATTTKNSVQTPVQTNRIRLQRMNPLHPNKLLLTKWTAVKPVAKEKHFLVVKVILPEMPEDKIEWVDIEAAYSKNIRRIAWRELRDQSIWRQGWV